MIIIWTSVLFVARWSGSRAVWSLWTWRAWWKMAFLSVVSTGLMSIDSSIIFMRQVCWYKCSSQHWFCHSRWFLVRSELAVALNQNARSSILSLLYVMYACLFQWILYMGLLWKKSTKIAELSENFLNQNQLVGWLRRWFGHVERKDNVDWSNTMWRLTPFGISAEDCDRILSRRMCIVLSYPGFWGAGEGELNKWL